MPDPTPPPARQPEVPDDWYATFFTELPNEFWRRAVSERATADDVDFVERQLALPPGSRILDVPCGSGRHAIALAARGHRVLGMDVSTEAIAHARALATRHHAHVEFVVDDMRAAPGDRSFDAAICMGNSFGYLDLAGTRAFVAALAASVRPGGGLAIDYAAAAESVLPGFTDGHPRDVTSGDIRATGSNTYDVRNSRLVSHYVFTRAEQRVEATALHHVHTVAQIVDLLTCAGFIDIELHGGPDGRPYELGGGRLLVTGARG